MKKNIKKTFIILVTILSTATFAFVLWFSVFQAPTQEISLPASIRNSVAQSGLSGAVVKGTSDGHEHEDVLTLDPPLTTESAPETYPKRLRVPTIKVNTKVQYVGITKKGNMATPSNFTDVGWWKYGAVPGESGSAVIAGHVDNGLALPGVFKNLEKVKKGDNIYIDTVGGETIKFVVTGTKLYDYNAKNTEEVFSQTGGKFLKLITCAGSWQNDIKTHDKRLVVTAKRI